jgi:cell growth-regulating nucleolar protein
MLQDFPGDSYKEHTKCISEAEKYSAKGWTPNASVNKGARKQAAWIERLDTLIEEKSATMDNDVKQLLEAIMGNDNIPRKRAKFINFAKNVAARRCSPSTIEKTWDIFEEALKEPKPVKTEEESNGNGKNSEEKENGQNEENGGGDADAVIRDGVPMFEGTKKAKKKKRKAQDEVAEPIVKKLKVDDVPLESAPTSPSSTKFDWIECISSILEDKGPIKMKKLKKKVVNEYVDKHPDTPKSRLDLEVKFQKKVAKCKVFKVTNETVELSISRK